MDDAERNLKAERDLKKALKDARNVQTGLKKTAMRSEKATTKKKETKKQDLTQEEMDQNKYLGQLNQVDEKKPN